MSDRNRWGGKQTNVGEAIEEETTARAVVRAREIIIKSE